MAKKATKEREVTSSQAERDLLTEVTDQESRFQPAYRRMDNDLDLFRLDPPYVLTDSEGSEISGVLNQTMNDSQVFGLRAIAIVEGSSRQFKIEGRKLKEHQAGKISKFLTDSFDMAAEELVKDPEAVEPFLHHTEQIMLYGRIGSRFYWRETEEEGVYVPDHLPLDMRYTAYKPKTNGIRWGSFRTTRDKDDILEQYKNADKKVRGQTGEILTVYTATDEVVYLDGREVISNEPHGFDEPPIVIRLCSSGSSFRSRTGREGQDYKFKGESIFGPNRELYNELNRVATINATLNQRRFRQALTFQSEQGNVSPPQNPYDGGEVIAVKTGQGYDAIPLADITLGSRLWYAILDGRVQLGSFSKVEHGNLEFQLSAIAITKLTENRNKVIGPRVKALQSLYAGLARMNIEQFKMLELDTETGTIGSREKYTADDLKGNYDIQYQLFPRDPVQDIANFSTATVAREFLAPIDVLSEVLQRQDPQGDLMRKRASMASVVFPSVLKFEVFKAVMDKDPKDPRLDLMAAELGIDLEETIAGGGVPQPVEAGVKPKGGGGATLPLLAPPGAGGGGAGRGQKGGPDTEPTENEALREVDNGS